MRLFRTIRVRLTAWYTLALLVLLTLAFLFIYFVARAQLYDTFDRDLIAHVQATAGAPDHEQGNFRGSYQGQSANGSLPPPSGGPPHHDDAYDSSVGEVVMQYGADGTLRNQITGQLS